MSKPKPGSLSAGLIAVRGQATPATTTVEPPIPAPAAPVVAVEPSPSPAVASVEPVADAQDETKEKRIAMTVKLEESLYWRLQDIVKAETRLIELLEVFGQLGDVHLGELRLGRLPLVPPRGQGALRVGVDQGNRAKARALSLDAQVTADRRLAHAALLRAQRQNLHCHVYTSIETYVLWHVSTYPQMTPV